MTTAATTLDELIARFHEGEADAHDAIFEWIEQAALVHVSSCVETVQRTLASLQSDDAARIFCWKGLAHALCYDNQFAAAADALRDAAALASRLGRESDQATLLLTMVQPLERLGRVDEAEDAARRALVTFQQRGDTFSAARAMVNLGVVRRVRGASRDALAWFDQARPAFVDHSLAAGTLETNAAEALLDLDRFDEAAAAFARSSQLFERGGHTLGTAIAQSNLADVYSRLGRIDEATLLFERAREGFAASDAPADAARLLAEEAEAFSMVGAFRRAVRLYEGALPALNAPGMTIELSRAHLGYGLCLLRLGAGTRAVETLTAAVALSQDDGTATVRQDAQVALAEAFITVGRFAQAIESLAALLPQLVSRPAKRAQALLAHAAASLALGDASAARDSLDTAAAVLEDSPVTSLRLRLRELRARLHALAGQHDSAWHELEHALHAAELFRGSIRAGFIRASFAESASDLYQSAIDAAMRLGGDAAPARVFGVIERSRARSLVETMAGRVAHGQASTADSRAAQLNAMYAAASKAEPDAATLRRIADLESQVELALDREEAARALSAVPVMPLADVQRSMGSSVAVSFFVHDHRLHALVITRSTATLQSLALRRSELVSLARRHALSIDVATRSSAGAASGAAAALTAMCTELLPLLRGADRVTLIPCRELHAFPMTSIMQTVLDQAGSTSVVTLAPSVTAGIALGASLIRSAGDALVVGVADETAPLMQEEAASVAACHRRAVTLLGAAATADAFLTNLPQHDVVHIATHCVFDPEFPMASRLKLSDRWVAAREFYGALRPGSVVVLAGCESGRTSESIGEDRFGLIRAMLVGGASLVIASHWRLHDASASRAFPLLHRLACSDSSPPALAFARALAGVRRTQIQNGEPWHVWQSLFAKGALP